MKKITLITGAIILAINANAQLLTREDSLNAGLNPSGKNVIISGYGEARYAYNQNSKTAAINLTRNVLFVGYRYSSKITFFSELEVEDAVVDAGGGELAMEQCVLKFDLNRNNYLLTGLFIPRIGIMNENHLPVNFNGNDRHLVERLVIPATWRELGIGYYGNSNKIAGLNWSLALMNGLNSEAISGAKGIRSARFEGRDATASNLALTGSLLYYLGACRFQLSGYYGGTVGLAPEDANSKGLQSGPFGTPVGLTEFNVLFREKGFSFKGLAAYCAIPDADKLNTAYSSNVANRIYGYMVEAGYNLLETSKMKDKQLTIFARYEKIDLMAKVPHNGIKDEKYNQQYIIAGLTFLPIRQVAIKFDWKHLATGEANPALMPSTTPYQAVNNFYQLGMAYSF